MARCDLSAFFGINSVYSLKYRSKYVSESIVVHYKRVNLRQLLKGIIIVIHILSLSLIMLK